jgi:hypothetical protein
MSRILKKGQGWRIGWDDQAPCYKGLVGSDDWALELTSEEFKEFCRLFTQLMETMKVMEEELMEEERISCEAQSDLLWLEVEGFPHCYSLSLILHQGRRAEGNWHPDNVMELAKAVDYFKDI